MPLNKNVCCPQKCLLSKLLLFQAEHCAKHIWIFSSPTYEIINLSYSPIIRSEEHICLSDSGTIFFLVETGAVVVIIDSSTILPFVLEQWGEFSCQDRPQIGGNRTPQDNEGVGRHLLSRRWRRCHFHKIKFKGLSVDRTYLTVAEIEFPKADVFPSAAAFCWTSIRICCRLVSSEHHYIYIYANVTSKELWVKLCVTNSCQDFFFHPILEPLYCRYFLRETKKTRRKRTFLYHVVRPDVYYRRRRNEDRAELLLLLLLLLAQHPLTKKIWTQYISTNSTTLSRLCTLQKQQWRK